MKYPRFQAGDRVRCRYGTGVITEVFWADAPGNPQDEHFRYYVQMPRDTYSCAERALVRAAVNPQELCTPKTTDLTVAEFESPTDGGSRKDGS